MPKIDQRSVRPKRRTSAQLLASIAETRAAKAHDVAIDVSLNPLARKLPRISSRLCARRHGDDARQWVIAGGGQGACVGKITRINFPEIGDLGLRQGQGPRLVEDNGVNASQSLQRLAGVEEHAPFEHGAGGHHLYGRHRKPQRAGAGDDENRDGDDKRRLPSKPNRKPAHEGRERRDMDNRRIEPRGAIRQTHPLRALLHRLRKQPVHVVKQRAARRLLHANAQGARHVHRARKDCPSRGGLAQRRFTSDEALVYVGASGLHDAVHGDALAGAHEHEVTGMDRSNGRFHSIAGLQNAKRDLRTHRGQIGRHIPRPAPHALVEHTARKQEHEQHDRTVEIGLLRMLQGLRNRENERQQNPQRNRHIHVEGALPDGAQGAIEKRAPGDGDRWQGDQRGDPVEHVARCGRQIARPYRHRQQHDVHHGEGGDAKRAQQAPLLIRLHAASGLRREGPGGKTQFIEPLHNEAGLHGALVPFHRDALAGEIDARAANAALGLQPLFDGRHATTAMDALDHQIHGRYAARGVTHENREILLDAHGRLSAAGPRRKVTRLRVS